MNKDEIAKQEIVEKAQVLFQQFGLKKTTMDEIALACGKAKSTLYHYFKSKEEVFDEVVKMEIRNLRIIVKNRVDEVRSVREKMNTYFITFHQEVINKINLYRIIKSEFIGVQNSRVHSPENSKKLDNLKKFLEFEKAYLTRILEDGYDCGEFTKIERDDIPYFAEVLIAAFLGITGYSIETDKEKFNEKLKKTSNILLDQIFG